EYIASPIRAYDRFIFMFLKVLMIYYWKRDEDVGRRIDSEESSRDMNVSDVEYRNLKRVRVASDVYLSLKRG
ncbi:MAG: hypothetical protein ACI8RD_014585, partial [Bacillariaceae sp.]